MNSRIYGLNNRLTLQFTRLTVSSYAYKISNVRKLKNTNKGWFAVNDG